MLINLEIASKEETLFGTARKVPCLCSFGYYQTYLLQVDCFQPATNVSHSSYFSIVFLGCSSCTGKLQTSEDAK